MSMTILNQGFVDSLMASMEKMLDEKLSEKNEKFARLRRNIRNSDSCKPNQNLQEYNRARPRTEQELTPKPPDQTSSLGGKTQGNANTQTVVEKRAKPHSYHAEKLATQVNPKKVEAEARHYPLEKLAKSVNKEKIEAELTSQLKEVKAQVLVHKQPQKPSFETSNEQKQCESSKLSKSREVHQYNCDDKVYLAETVPRNKEQALTSLEPTPCSSNSRTEIVHHGLENSSSCMMHLVLPKVVDSGEMKENDKAEASGEHNAVEKLPRGIILPLTPKRRTRGTYLESKNRMKPNLLSVDACQTVLRTTLFKEKDYNDARSSTNIESSAEVVAQQANRENCIGNSFDVLALQGPYLFNLKELGNEVKCFGNLTLQSIFSNLNHHNANSYEEDMNFSNWPYRNVPDLDIRALQGTFCSNEKESEDDPTCSRLLSLQETTSNWFHAKIDLELKDIDSTTQTILRVPSFGLPINGMLQTYIWRPGEFSKQLICDFKVNFIFENTDMNRWSLSKESNAGYGVPMGRTRPIYEHEEDDRFKPPDLDQDKYKLVNYFLLNNREPLESNFKTKPDKFIYGVRLLIYDCLASNIFSFVYAGSDLRTNSFQEGGDDTILDRHELVDGSENEEEFEAEINTKDPKEDNEVITPTGLITRSRTSKPAGILQQSVRRIEEQFKDLSLRNVTTTFQTIQAQESPC